MPDPSTTRRRKSAAADALSAPLLPEGERSDAAVASTSEPTRLPAKPFAGPGALIVRGVRETEWARLWDWLWHHCCPNWGSLWATLTTCLLPVLPQSMRPVRLTPEQGERWHSLTQQVAVRFDVDNPEHQEVLRQLWQLAFPGEDWVGLRSARWTDLGWQRDDPSSDIRGGGLLSLTNLLFMAKEQPDVFERLRSKADGKRSEWEYPFAVAGVNLTFMLEAELGLRDARTAALHPAAPPTTPAAAGFALLLGARPQLLEEVFCCAFEALDAQWLRMRASYMDFPVVMRATRERLAIVLAARPASLSALRARLLEE